MSGPSLQVVSNWAGSAGLSPNVSAYAPVASCPAKAKAAGGAAGGKAASENKPLEYCDIKQLQVVMSAPDKAATFTIDKKRTTEKTDLSKVAKEYRSLLGSYDIVIEALGDIVDDTYDNGKPAPSKDNRPLSVKATAVNKCSHTSFTPAHPRTSLGKMNSEVQLTDGGAPASGTYYSLSPGGASNMTWAALWPLNSARTAQYSIAATSCGNLPIPQLPTSTLAAKLVVLPYEEWTITIGLKGMADGSYGKESNAFGNQDGKSGRSITSTTTVKKRSGNTETSSVTQQMETAAGAKRSRTTNTTTQLDYRLLSTESDAVATIQQSWKVNGKASRPKTTESTDKDYRKVTIKRKVAGREVEVDVSDTIKKIMKIKELIDDTKKIFESVKIGWSITFSYDLFSGNLNFGWGNRWPKAYKEEQRVYYVERFIKAGGQLDVVTGSVTGFFGFAVDPWFAPVAIDIGAYLTASAKVAIAAQFELTYTNAVSSPSGTSGTLSPTATIGFEMGAKANGRAFGYSVESKLALESEASLTFEGKISSQDGPYLKGTLMIGKESDASTAAAPQADAIRLIGQVVFTGSSVRRYQIKPIVLVKGFVVFKDKYFWGTAPK